MEASAGAPPQPSLGRIVHYVETPHEGAERGVEHAAIVSAFPVEHGGTHHVHLTVFTEYFETHQRRVPYAPPDEWQPNSWHWPERI